MLVWMHSLKLELGNIIINHSFEGCKSADQLETYNKCWASCKQATAYANNGLYNSLGICYENICYVNEMFLIKIIGFMILTFLLLA